MTKETKTEVKSTLTDEIVPGVTNEMVSYQDADSEEQQRIDALMAEINIADANSIIFFGTKAQEKVTDISDKMLEGVKNKDLGQSGEALNEMVATIRGFDVDELDPNKKPGFFARLFGKSKPLVKFLQKYEDVKSQIEKITIKLEGHKTTLLKDITSLDRLYVANLEYFHNLEDYIKAGEEKLRQLHDEVIPQMEKEASNTDDMLAAQKLRDIRSATADLERRVHDLRLTRQVTLQSLPSIRLVQENDKGLINKINSTIANTIPLWRQQLAQTVTIWRSEQAADTLKDATDLTNEMLAANAENLQIANRKVREQMERGVFDIEVIKEANQKLIATIDDSLRIAEEGKAKREAAVIELQQTESQLREALLTSKAQYSQVEHDAKK
ncbi:toxic anion resistance protein [Marinicella gelatinilytica]|uniref:toxic anion resistance protein n=1 Tax=Marinicella gelatinilytica TaxID=2996017 RepID=UPI002260DD3E|nr:toxic anion resistance protein [Marinicella gelatinilytica]MCX7544768.1 toxic anion resistance protein [Marinicella gelatinilytica]